MAGAMSFSPEEKQAAPGPVDGDGTKSDTFLLPFIPSCILKIETRFRSRLATTLIMHANLLIDNWTLQHVAQLYAEGFNGKSLLYAKGG